ncbi:hypothetical protein [Nonomuraea lactucae]|uniref:hypothetical protein n=1 Tax=Nonomuraea lactucae TaxID=2249762 RepID=UPI0013B43C0F|nr:hypothetical protein [Nonomuraea lactucae]
MSIKQSPADTATDEPQPEPETPPPPTPSTVHVTQRIASGHTAPGQGWDNYYGTGICIDVDTSSARFSGTPVYTASIGGLAHHWLLSGMNAIYDSSPTGFRLYLRRSDGTHLEPADAQLNGWYVNWIGIDQP